MFGIFFFLKYKDIICGISYIIYYVHDIVDVIWNIADFVQN
jgi:hypothetical protein